MDLFGSYPEQRTTSANLTEAGGGLREVLAVTNSHKQTLSIMILAE